MRWISLYAKEIPYTQDDRDRLIRVEVEVKEGLKAVNQRIDGLERSVNQRIDRLHNLMYVVISAIFVQIAGVVGFVLWDRRTTLAPAIRKTREIEEELAIVVKKAKELEEREAMLERALKDFARQESRLADALRSVRLL